MSTRAPAIQRPDERDAPPMPTQNLIATMARLRAAHDHRPDSPPTLTDLRRAFTPAGVRFAVPDDVTVVPATAGGVDAHWFRASGADAARAVLYLHGGGFSLGSHESHGELIARIARACGIQVLAADYRLAPEHPFPAAVEDATAVWRWLRDDLRLPAGRLAVVGDSAGGGLALSLLVALRDAGEDLPAGVVVMSPWTDLTLSGASLMSRVDADPVLDPALLRSLADRYLAGADPRSPLASPLLADLSGLPPLLIQVGTEEILFDDAERLAERAEAAGVDVTLQVTQGAPHVFQSMVGAPEATEATDEIATFIAAWSQCANDSVERSSRAPARE